MQSGLPPIPAKRYFTIGEVGELCGVKPHVLRYWEQEFAQLRPMKRQGNRRYYQHHEVLMIRRIRELLYDQGYSIQGARQQLLQAASRAPRGPSDPNDERNGAAGTAAQNPAAHPQVECAALVESVTRELRRIREILSIDS